MAPESWRCLPLGALVESAVDGPFGSNLKSNHYVAEPGVRVVRLQNIGVDEFDDEDHAWVSEEHARKLSRHEVRARDVLVASLGDENHPFGRACLYPPDQPPAIVKADCFRLRMAPQMAAPEFISRALNCDSLRRALNGLAQGVTRDRVNLGNLLRFEVPVPPITEQRQIAIVLDTLDSAVRTTELIVAKLKQVKQGLLRDLLTRGIDDNGELRDPERHPEQFKGSPLERIPKDWTVGPLEAWLDGSPKNGHSPKSVEGWTGRLMLGLGCLTTEGFVPAQLKNAPRNDPKLDGAALSDGDLLISRANTRDLVGLAGIYRDVGHPCTYPDLMMRLTPLRSRADASFLELMLRAPMMRRQIQAAASGTSSSMVKISGAIVKRLRVAMPPPEEQSRLVDRMRSAQARLADEERYAAKLGHLKRGLMEDLLTGRVRVTQLLENAAE